LREHLKAPPRNQQQPVKLLQQSPRTADLVAEILSLGAPNLSLNGIFVQSAEKLFETWPEVELMKAI
jgi:hypothetical protein